MANQEQSRDETPRKDQDRPSQASGSPSAQDDRGEGPGRIGEKDPSDADAKRNR